MNIESPSSSLGLRELYPAHQSNRTPPVNIRDGDASLFEHELTRAIPSTNLRVYQSVTADAAGIVVAQGQVLAESLLPHDSMLSTRGRRLRWRMKRLIARETAELRPCIWVVDQWSNGYFHWFLDALPRVYAMRDQLADSVVLLPHDYRRNAFVAASLRALGARNIRYIEEGEVVRARRLLVPSHTATTGNYNEEIVRALRDALTSYFGCGRDPDPYNRIYISRAGAQRRRLVNEEELMPLLEECGFSVQHFETLPWAEQVRKSSEAACLVSLHGSGLANMLFMRPGTSVLEIRRESDGKNNCYFSLASALGIRYFYMFAKALDESRDTQSADLCLSPAHLRGALASMLTTP